jgi:hypothetical protein
MSPPTAIMPDSNSQTITDTSNTSKPAILDILPDLPISDQRCAIRVQQRIDLMLLALEALQLGGSEYMLAMTKELQLEGIIKNRLVLWKLRCSNSWRQCYTREPLSIQQAKALVIIIGYQAKQLMVLIRQLLIAHQQMTDKNMPLESNFRLSEYLERFAAHFRSRMNPNRAKVSIYLTSPDELNNLAILLLGDLLFCSGTKGMQRFWVSLFDGEVA